MSSRELGFAPRIRLLWIFKLNDNTDFRVEEMLEKLLVLQSLSFVEQFLSRLASLFQFLHLFRFRQL